MRQSTRRHFLKSAVATAFAAPVFIRNLRAAAPNEVVRHASFGAGGMAAADLSQITKHPNVKLVCVADVDLDRAEKLKTQFPDLRIYQDWRKMLEKEHNNLDSVNVSTPDHMHAPMGIASLEQGLHVYGQKPLTHDVYESRRLAKIALEKKRVTQMGIQIHSDITYRSAVQIIQNGTIGKVKAVHSWSDKRWGDPDPRPDRTDPIPPKLDWDLWLGVCEPRPFIGDGYYHPGNWRKRLDFGTGTFGDMGCHIFDPVFKALELTAPTTLKSEGTSPNKSNWSNDAKVRMTFPQTPFTVGPEVVITWYDGTQRPELDSKLWDDSQLPGQGSLFIGEKGVMVLPHIAPPQLFPKVQFADFKMPQLEPVNHWFQFVDAVRGMGTTSAHFGYAGPLTESVLLGGLSTFFPGQQLEWDAANLAFKNKPDAGHLIRRPYRKGWEV